MYYVNTTVNRKSTILRVSVGPFNGYTEAKAYTCKRAYICYTIASNPTSLVRIQPRGIK